MKDWVWSCHLIRDISGLAVIDLTQSFRLLPPPYQLQPAIKTLTISTRSKQIVWNRSYLHHEDDSVESNQHHDEILEGRGNNHLPDLVFEGAFVLWHEATQRFGTNGEVDALFLEQRSKKRWRHTDITWLWMGTYRGDIQTIRHWQEQISSCCETKPYTIDEMDLK